MAQAAGHQVSVVPSVLSRALGAGCRGTKTDVRDARALSEASTRVALPSVHIPTSASRSPHLLLVMSFVYCLLILRSIRRAEGFVFVPHLSVSFGVLLAIVSLAVLIHFIHHVAISIQADEVISRVSTELIRQIDRLFPERVGREATDPAGPPDASQFHAAFDGQARTVGAAGAPD